MLEFGVAVVIFMVGGGSKPLPYNIQCSFYFTDRAAADDGLSVIKDHGLPGG